MRHKAYFRGDGLAGLSVREPPAPALPLEGPLSKHQQNKYNRSMMSCPLRRDKVEYGVLILQKLLRREKEERAKAFYLNDHIDEEFYYASEWLRERGKLKGASGSDAFKQRITNENVKGMTHAEDDYTSKKNKLGAVTALENPIEAPNTTAECVANPQDHSSQESGPEAAVTPPAQKHTHDEEVGDPAMPAEKVKLDKQPVD